METMKERILFLEAQVATELINKWGISPMDFSKYDLKYNLLPYIESEYERLHMTGIKGAIQEVEQFIEQQGGIVPNKRNRAKQ